MYGIPLILFLFHISWKQDQIHFISNKILDEVLFIQIKGWCCGAKMVISELGFLCCIVV